MIRFLFIGLIRDRSRSTLPILVVAIGVALTVFMHAYITGVMHQMIETTANFTTGHVSVMTKPYAANSHLKPNDLALLGSNALQDSLHNVFPNCIWVERINFGGILDVPDAHGETKTQGPVVGIGLDLLSPHSTEIERLQLTKAILHGALPQKQGEILISDLFAQKLRVAVGDTVTLMSTSMHGSMAFYNFTIAGTLIFGNPLLDRGTIMVDILDTRLALDMHDASSEILGFFRTGYYHEAQAETIRNTFISLFENEYDEYSPTMLRLRDHQSMGVYVDMSKSMGAIISLIFILAMSLVLWNTGIIGGIRRYGEIGIRLAMGEAKSHIYKTMLMESCMIGILGTIVGTLIGLLLAWLLQTYGLDISEFSNTTAATVMMPSVIRALITPIDFVIGFIPGVLSTLVGTALAGIGVYKRSTAQLFKELEV